MKFSNLFKILVFSGLFLIYAFVIGVIVFIVFIAPLNIHIYLIPPQIRYEFNSQTYLIQFYSPTQTTDSTNPLQGLNPSRPFIMPQTATPLPSLTPTVTATFTPTPTSTPTFTPTITMFTVVTQTPSVSTGDIPVEARINNINGHRQLYTLDCESRSAVDLAAFYGISIDENEFLDKLPKSSNPDTGFVGSVTDPRGKIPPNSYGVHAGPIAALLRDYGLNAIDHHGMSLLTLKKEIAAGRPVIVWVIGNTVSGYGVTYHAPDGNDTIVAPYEHTVIVIGYNANYITLLDENKIYQRSVSSFEKSWAVLGNMAVTITQ